MFRKLPVSVVISAYNSERFVADAVRTVQRQSAPPSEIILVDDGSRDHTAQIAAALGAAVFSQANAGSAAARHKGARVAQTPWLAFLDVDDLWAPEKLDLQWQALQACPDAGFAFCEYATFNESGIVIPSYLAGNAAYRTMQRPMIGPSVVFAARDDLARQLLRENFMLPSGLLVRRDLFLEIGGFDESVRRCEDYEFFLRLLTRTDGVIVERRALFYREHDTSKSAAWHASLLGKNAVGERVAEQPDCYPAGTVAAFASARVSTINAAGENLLRNQRYRDARTTALGGLREAPSWKGLAIVLLSLILDVRPFRNLHSALRAHRRGRVQRSLVHSQMVSARRDLSRAFGHISCVS
jgi:GT2 family glycosyltransferase